MASRNEAAERLCVVRAHGDMAHDLAQCTVET